MLEQKTETITLQDLPIQLLESLQNLGIRKPLLVCDAAFDTSTIVQQLLALPGIEMTMFHDFKANPDFNAVIQSIETFNINGCDGIIALGGGSTMDVAKGTKAYLGVRQFPLVQQLVGDNQTPLIAIPTTAGTGSDATHFAVLFKQHVKYAVESPNLLPTKSLLVPALLTSLSHYQRKVGMLDTLCQAIESYWSLKATAESRRLARQAIQGFLDNYQGFLTNTQSGNKGMLLAAHTAGMAIDITATTAPHAMSYQLTARFQLAHGHAVALCLPKVWQYMVNQLPQISLLERAPLQNEFQELAELLGQKSPQQAIQWFENLVADLDLVAPGPVAVTIVKAMVAEVNVQRLQNNPMPLDKNALTTIYNAILN
ncbi:hypothetical protein FC83_GL001730 [Agrilactobacillus composti DSM 18527 = JCM 14202]|uniref:Uncharacterized protein n=1 Tax=Agrilactobacillus composti DSM 18527 = JCM 14202 TaxID=1423734 RepID=A0A0R1XKB6_9LACO|nr:phosphonoacetaldehyde reductase [Agrilactobacillus composti]KRM30594.1 hypothetical protein FC83_GL001730 [Agrilactobacillus composti DSM 18527 = JCM 14202]